MPFDAFRSRPEDAANAFLLHYGHQIVPAPGAGLETVSIRRGLTPGEDEIALARRHMTRRRDWQELQDGYGCAFRYPAQESAVKAVQRAIRHSGGHPKMPLASPILIAITIARQPWPVSQTILLDRMEIERVEGALPAGHGWSLAIIGLREYRLAKISEAS
ncbi:hypothetical protein EON77_10995 [bacterium]|nr:MAG: hypothetical protein EON77_10995 [bacterium]